MKSMEFPRFFPRQCPKKVNRCWNWSLPEEVREDGESFSMAGLFAAGSRGAAKSVESPASRADFCPLVRWKELELGIATARFGQEFVRL